MAQLIHKPVKDIAFESAIALLMLGFVLGSFFFVWFHYLGSANAISNGDEIVNVDASPVTLIEATAVILTAVGVIVTVFAVGIAVLGLFGFRILKQQAVSVATKEIERQVAEGGILYKLAANKMDEVVNKPKVNMDMEWGDEDTETGDPADYVRS